MMPTLRQACVIGATALWLVHATAAAGPTTPDCKRALDELQQHEAQAPARGASAPAVSNDPQLRALRSRTASICLGGPDEARQPGNPPAPAPAGERARSAARTAEGTVRVPPVTAPLPARRAAPPEPLPPLPAPRSPTVVLGCDAAGCWGSDGSRLQRMGPNLVAPSGQCVLGGSVIQCP